MNPGRSGPAVLVAEAKLTLSLRVTGVRPDGYHLLRSEMVTVDLADRLEVGEGTGLTVATEFGPAPGPTGGTGPALPGPVGTGPDNLVSRALEAAGRTARVHLVKRIPPGAGLGGGSADAAAVLRWAGCADPGVAAGLGADVPFCLGGGRARVTGIGEVVEPLPYEDRSFVLLLPPFGVDTVAVYRAYDRLAADGRLPPPGTAVNDLEAAALHVEPRLAGWFRALAEATGRTPRLAGSGSTWFVEGDAAALGLGGRKWLEVDGQRAPLVATGTSPPGG